MSLYTESSTQTGMEGHSRSSSKYLLLQVWCGLLTVAMVAMAALLATIKPKLTEDGVSALKSDNASSTVSSMASLKSQQISSPSYIQLSVDGDKGIWKEDEPKCDSCSLVLRDNRRIECKKSSIYFIYAQVTFANLPKSPNKKSVILTRDKTHGKRAKTLLEGSLNTTGGSVWVAKIVSLGENDTISLNISGHHLSENTFWGAFQLH